MSKVISVGNKMDKFVQLKNDRIFSYLKGDYKGVRELSKQIAREAVDDFDTFTKARTMQGRYPLFSKPGINTLFVHLLTKFAIKTTEEKLLNTQIAIYKLEQNRHRTKRIDAKINYLTQKVFKLKAKLKI